MTLDRTDRPILLAEFWPAAVATDIDIKAGQSGTNLCRFTGAASAQKQRGKRQYLYNEKTVGRASVDLWKKAADDAWNLLSNGVYEAIPKRMHFRTNASQVQSRVIAATCMHHAPMLARPNRLKQLEQLEACQHKQHG